jgi:hypothetical protein
LKSINLALSFFVEVAMLAGFGYWGYRATATPWLKWVLALGLPLLVIIPWALYLAPKAARRVRANTGIPVTLGLFYLAALAFAAAGRPAWGIALAALATLNRALAVAWKQW